MNNPIDFPSPKPSFWMQYESAMNEATQASVQLWQAAAQRVFALMKA